jgi:hypothetical protein
MTGSTAEVSQQHATNSSKTAGVKRDQLEQGTPIPHHDQDMPSTSAPKKAKHEEGGVECHIYWSGLHKFQWKYCAVAKDPKTGVTAKGDYKLSEDGAKKHAMKNLAIALQDHGIADSVDYTPPASSQVEPDQSSSPPEQLKSEPGIQHKGISKPDTDIKAEADVETDDQFQKKFIAGMCMYILLCTSWTLVT